MKLGINIVRLNPNYHKHGSKVDCRYNTIYSNQIQSDEIDHQFTFLKNISKQTVKCKGFVLVNCVGINEVGPNQEMEEGCDISVSYAQFTGAFIIQTSARLKYNLRLLGTQVYAN